MRDDQGHKGRLPRHVLTLSVGALAGVILVIVAVVALGLRLWDLPAGGPSAQASGEPSRIQPALETAPQPDRAQFVQTEQRRLASFGWVDKARGVAHIPLDDALRLAAEGQLPLPGKAGPTTEQASPAGGTP